MTDSGYCSSVLVPNPGRRRKTKEHDDPADVLKRASLVAIGGVGCADTLSEGETASRQVVKPKDPAPVLIKRLSEATPEGQRYALVGLKAIDHAEFRSRPPSCTNGKTWQGPRAQDDMRK